MTETLSFFVVALIALPLLSAIGVAVLGPRRADAVRWVSLGSTLLSLVLSVMIAWGFAESRLGGDGSAVKGFTPAMPTKVDLLQLEKPSTDSEAAPAAIRFFVGIDGLNIWLVLLTSLLMVCSILSSWESIQDRVHEYYAWMLVLQMAMVGVFLSFDIILFYVFFELTLVPLFFLIGIWGGPQRQYAARKFFIFTLAGSLITLLGVLGAILMFSTVGYSVPNPDKMADSGVKLETKLTFSIPELVDLTQRVLRQARASDEVVRDLKAQRDQAANEAEKNQLQRKIDLTEREVRGTEFWQRVQFWIFLTMMVGFAVKVPLFPVHTWLPLAHTEAPTAGSVLLAGVLLKIGTYGFLRLCIPLTPDASVNFGAPFLGWLAVIGIIYGAFCALQQDDIKKMVAYSSVSHLGFCILGMFALNEAGIAGSLLQMVNHGLSTGALFLLVGMLYDRYHTRKIVDYGGMGARLKLLAVAFVFITMSSVGLPGLNGFVGEVLVLLGAYGSKVTTINGPLLASLAALGVILGAWYMLTLVMKVFFGEVKEPHHEGHAISDLDGREIALLVPIALCCLAIGLFPQPFIETAEPEIKYVAALAKDAREGYKEKQTTQSGPADDRGGALSLTGDPCRLVRQVKQFDRLEGAPEIVPDPCRLVRQVKQFDRLERSASSSFLDPCRLVRQVKQFGRLEGAPGIVPDPCRLVRQVKQFDGLAAGRRPASKLLHLPHKAAGVEEARGVLHPLAIKLLHLPHKAAGVGALG